MTEQNTFSISELQQKANDGDAQAQFELALCYAKGTDIEKNIELVFDWHKKAAEQGHVNAQFALGLYYFLNNERIHQTVNLVNTLLNKWVRDKLILNNVDPVLDLAVSQAWEKRFSGANDDLAFKWLKKAAVQDNAEANYWLGQCFRNGIGTVQNDELAFDCFRIAAEQGLAESQYSLAYCYFEGKGIEQRDELGLKWCEKAAETGFPEAQYHLACRYLGGGGATQNIELGLKWLMKAAEEEHTQAEARLADCYEHGTGVEKNNKQAFALRTKVANKGHAVSQYWLARYYFNGGIFEQLGEIDRKILEQDGDSHPEYWRNVYLEKGYERAFSWANEAVENGCGEAYLLLGFMSAYGLGVEQDSEQAFECFEKAVEHNKQGIADYFLANFYSLGIGVEQNDRLADIHKNRADSEKVRQYFCIERLLENADERHRNRFLHLEIDYDIECGRFNSARNKIKEHVENNPNEMKFALSYIDKAEQLVHKNQELEETNKKLKEAQIELEDMMSMFAHKFRSPLDAIIYNATHENQVKLYTEVAQTMRGLLNIFSIISTDADILKEKIKQDRLGSGRLATVFSKTLDMILLHLLSASGAEKIQQHYMAYAKAHGQCDMQVSYKTWDEEYFELEQALQAEWEQSFAQLLNQSATLEQRLAWLEQHFFKLDLIGFDRTDIQFKEYGVIESFLTILLNEILVNAFKYYSSASKQPVALEWAERTGYQVLICRNPSIRSERTIPKKGNHKGHTFLSALARKTGSAFTKPTPQDDFVVEFGIPDELLISK